MEVGVWLAHLEENRAAAWIELADAMRVAVESLSRRRRVGTSDADDLASEAVVRVMTDDARSVRRAAASAPLGAWCMGFVRNLCREAARRNRRLQAIRAELARRSDSTDEPLASDAARGAASEPIASRTRLELQLARCRPTDLQRAVFELRVDAGLSFAAIATRLGRHDTTIKESWKRLVRRLRDPPPPRPPRDWTQAAVREARLHDDRRGELVFLLHAEGRTRSEIASRTGWSRDAVAVKLRRARRRHSSAPQR
jgi:RNA polymerase sigma factor (sigma-70 family)